MALSSPLGKEERKDGSATDLDAGANKLCHRGQCRELGLAFLEGRAEDSEFELIVRGWR